MNNLVKVFQEDVFTDSLVIAEGTGNAHRSVVKIIKKYSDYFLKMGFLTVHSKLSDNLRKTMVQVYRLNEPQATFLMTLLGNSEIVVNFKLELVKQFYTMRQILL